MNLPLAPPPGLPLPIIDEATRNALIKQYTVTDTSYVIPLIAFGIIAFYALTEFLKWMFPPKKKPANWQEEFIDPFIGTSSASLTTTEIITRIFKKDPHLAEHVEPLLHQMDLVNFSAKKENIQPIITKTKNLFAATIQK